MSTATESVAVRIRELRLARGWSQEKLAEEATLSRDAVTRIERGNRGPRLDTLKLIADAFGISLPELLDFEEPPPPRSRAQEDRAQSLERSLDLLDPWLADALIAAVRGVAQAHLRASRKRGKSRARRMNAAS